MEQPLVDAAALARWLGYSALFLVIGAFVFQVLLRWLDESVERHGPGLRRRAALLGAAAAVVLLIALALRLFAQARSFSDPGEPLTLELIRPIVAATSWGGGWRVQVFAAVISLAGLLLALRWKPGWILAGLGALASVGAAPLTGHALEHPWKSLGMVMQVVHVGAGAIWIGSRFLLVATVYPATRGDPGERERLVSCLVRAYSPVALVAGIGTIVLGLLLGWNYVGGFGALIGTPYGLTLLVKVLLLAGVAGLGAWNWRRVRPVLGSAPGAARLRVSATAELVLGTLLLAATAVLVALPAPEI